LHVGERDFEDTTGLWRMGRLFFCHSEVLVG
jgi:hypothetical protein